jgi:hypothetical protein
MGMEVGKLSVEPRDGKQEGRKRNNERDWWSRV